MSILERTSLIVFNMIINFAHALLLYLSLNYYLNGSIVLAVTCFLFLLSLVILQCHQIIKFVERCKLKKEERQEESI